MLPVLNTSMRLSILSLTIQQKQSNPSKWCKIQIHGIKTKQWLLQDECLIIQQTVNCKLKSFTSLTNSSNEKQLQYAVYVA